MVRKHTCPEGAEAYYNVEKALQYLNDPEYLSRKSKLLNNIELVWWRCVLCGFPSIVEKEVTSQITCGGCGQSTMRPIKEYEGME